LFLSGRDTTREWYWEGNVQARIRAHLEAAGWKTLQSANTEERAQGIDLLLGKDAHKRAVEVKGYPSTKYAHGAETGPDQADPTNRASPSLV